MIYPSNSISGYQGGLREAVGALKCASMRPVRVVVAYRWTRPDLKILKNPDKNGPIFVRIFMDENSKSLKMGSRRDIKVSGGANESPGSVGHVSGA